MYEYFSVSTLAWNKVLSNICINVLHLDDDKWRITSDPRTRQMADRLSTLERDKWRITSLSSNATNDGSLLYPRTRQMTDHLSTLERDKWRITSLSSNATNDGSLLYPRTRQMTDHLSTLERTKWRIASLPSNAPNDRLVKYINIILMVHNTNSYSTCITITGMYTTY